MRQTDIDHPSGKYMLTMGVQNFLDKTRKRHRFTVTDTTGAVVTRGEMRGQEILILSGNGYPPKAAILRAMAKLHGNADTEPPPDDVPATPDKDGGPQLSEPFPDPAALVAAEKAKAKPKRKPTKRRKPKD